MKWNPVETIPIDGTEILIKTDTGIVTAWLCREEQPTDGISCVYEWVCFDDMFTLDGYDNNIEGWLPLDILN
ncbi:MAG: hypothetical protein HQM11_07795 [SAR324 cluster bacterium]|nr:hypothetical protein [SAR324 cluster bacterium]